MVTLGWHNGEARLQKYYLSDKAQQIKLLQPFVETAEGNNQDQKDGLPGDPHAYSKPSWVHCLHSAPLRGADNSEQGVFGDLFKSYMPIGFSHHRWETGWLYDGEIFLWLFILLQMALVSFSPGKFLPYSMYWLIPHKH